MLVEGTRVRFKLERDAKKWQAVFHAIAHALSFYESRARYLTAPSQRDPRVSTDVNKSKVFAYALAAWLILEALAFVIVVELFGVTAALALAAATTLIGLLDIKKLYRLSAPPLGARARRRRRASPSPTWSRRACTRSPRRS